VKEKLTMGILGDTGSGKTFLMECLIQSIPKQERLITVESARELQLPDHRNKVQLLYSHFGTGAAALDASTLMAVTKRMKPKRVLLGECIGPEAFVFLNMVVSGHAGSITSWHAKSIHVARERFVLMCREHPDAKLHTPRDLGDLFDLSMDAMVHIAVEEPAPGQDPTKKRRYVSDVWFNPAARHA
jgi:type IV secretion system protein VirB11